MNKLTEIKLKIGDIIDNEKERGIKNKCDNCNGNHIAGFSLPSKTGAWINSHIACGYHFTTPCPKCHWDLFVEYMDELMEKNKDIDNYPLKSKPENNIHIPMDRHIDGPVKTGYMIQGD